MLGDLLVLDLTQYLPGPYATQLLAGLGARVVKIEPPAGDPMRHLPPHDAEGVSAVYRALNQGKRSLAVDLKRPAGRDLVLDLAAQADVLVEGFRPGVLDRLGLGADACRARNPRLVVCAITGFGRDGPYRDRPGHDLNYQAYAGALGITTDVGGAPVTPGLQPGDLLAALSALVGILAALREREQTGRGRVVDAAMLDALVSAQGMHIAAHLAGQRAAPRAMPLNGGLPCYGTYVAADGGAVALAALEPKFWAAFCEVTGEEGWLARQYDPDLRAEVAALFATRPRDEWRLILEDVGCCLAPVLSYDEMLADPQVQARGLVQGGLAGAPLRFEPPFEPPRSSPGAPPCVASRPGAHTRALLAELLGLEEAAIEALRRDGAVLAP